MQITAMIRSAYSENSELSSRPGQVKRRKGNIRKFLFPCLMAFSSVVCSQNSKAVALAGVTINQQDGLPGIPDENGGNMYMYYIETNTSNGQISATSAYINGAASNTVAIAPLEFWSPGDTYSSTLQNGVTSPWAHQLNPTSAGGLGQWYGRYMGISLSNSTNTRNWMNTNGYSLAIQILDIPEGIHFYYYNNGTDAYQSSYVGTFSEDKVAWDELNDSNYVVWDGTKFSNMLHLAVVSDGTVPYGTEFNVTYSFTYITSDPTGANLAATVVDENTVTALAGTTTWTQSFNYLVVPEPSTYGLLGGGLIVCLGAALLQRSRAKQRPE